MSFSFPKYTHFHEHKMDSKFRVSIPVAWRPEEGEQLILMHIHKNGTPLIRVLTAKALEKAIHDIENSNCTSGQIREAIEELYTSILPVYVNNQGKLLIPKDLSLRTNIAAESNVVLSGRGDYFDIYSADDYAKVSAAQSERVSTSMASLNIFST